MVSKNQEFVGKTHTHTHKYGCVILLTSTKKGNRKLKYQSSEFIPECGERE